MVKKIAVVIPVYKYNGQVESIIKSYECVSPDRITIFNDSGYKMNFKSRPKIVNTSKIGLKGVLTNACIIYYDYDAIIINEHDVLVSEKTIKSALKLYEKYIDKMIASVSCVYTYLGKNCYPTHKDWFNGKKRFYDGMFGELAVIGAEGVPFGFSIWKPEALIKIDDSALPDTWKLDSKFGVKLFNEGYRHIRMIDEKVEHINRGVKSWKFNFAN